MKEKEPDPHLYPSYAKAWKEYGDTISPLLDYNSKIIQEGKDLRKKLKTLNPVDYPGKEPSFAAIFITPVAILLLATGIGWCYYWLLGLMFDFAKEKNLVSFWISPIMLTIAAVALLCGIIYLFKRKRYEKRFSNYEFSEYKTVLDKIDLNNAEFIKNRDAILAAYPPVMHRFENVPEQELVDMLETGHLIYERVDNDSDDVYEKWTDYSTLICCEDRYREIPDYLLRPDEDGTPLSKYPVPEPEINENFTSKIFSLLTGGIGIALGIDCILWVFHKFGEKSDDWIFIQVMLIVGVFLALIAFTGLILGYYYQFYKWDDDKADFDRLVSRRNHLKKLEDSTDEAIFTVLDYVQPLSSKTFALIRKLLIDNLGFPLKNFSDWSFREALEAYNALMKRRRDMALIPFAQRGKLIRDFYNDKLDLFYKRSLKAEAGDDSEVYSYFESLQPADYRQDLTPIEATRPQVERLSGKIDSLVDYDSAIEDFTDLIEADTSGTFLEHDRKKVEAQTREMEKVYNEFATQVTKFDKHVERINRALNMARMVAFRNLFLGAELINVVREQDKDSGGGLTKLNDSVDSINVSAIEVSEDVPISSNTFSDIMGASFGSVASAVENVLNDKAARKYYSKNPKEALMTAAGVALISAINAGIEAWRERNRVISECLEKQELLVSEMDDLVEKFLDSQAKARRAYELTLSLVKLNEGFMFVYNDLRDKVFATNSPGKVTMVELQSLARAIMEYKKAADSKL